VKGKEILGARDEGPGEVKGGALRTGKGTAAGRKAARKAALAGLFALLLLVSNTYANDVQDPTNLFGSRGLIGTPSARVAPDGELSAGASFLRDNQHYNMTALSV
jgi:hypothetical protein